jgi:hypothetical protein
MEVRNGAIYQKLNLDARRFPRSSALAIAPAPPK